MFLMEVIDDFYDSRGINYYEECRDGRESGRL